MLFFFFFVVCFFQAEDGIRDLVRSRGLGDVYKRQGDEALEKEVRPCRVDFGDAEAVADCRVGSRAAPLSLIHI